MTTAYSTGIDSYIIICDWGTPRFDLGSVYYFDTVDRQFPFGHFYYVPSTGELSTGIESRGTARRISTTYKSVRSRFKTKATDSTEDRKSELYLDYLQNKQESARKPKNLSRTEIRLKDQLRRMLEIK
jgi:hypothetical protein